MKNSDNQTDRSGSAFLHFKGVSKSFQTQTVLDSLDLTMHKGEFLTLLGPSGCGKTTSLNLAAGLLDPDSGEILLRGKRANGVSSSKRDLGLVFQSWALFPHMTVYENVAYGLRVRRVQDAEIKNRVMEMLELVRLSGADAKYPSQLSGGMQQRVALARALAPKPDLLLLDEPLSNLDAALRKEMQVELRRIHETLSMSTLLVTHSQEEALVMSDRIAIMRAGKIEALAEPRAAYNEVRSEFAYNFIGEANTIEGRVAKGGTGGAALVEVDGGQLSVKAPRALQPGDLVRMGIRPESVSMQARSTGPGTIDGCVTQVIFRGSQNEYRVQVGGVEFQAFTSAELDPGHKVGDLIGLFLPEKRIVVFDPESGQ